jgi:Fe-S-cluster-containing dehydrogenase component
MARKALVVDLDRCIGCHACTVACKQENNVRLGAYWNSVVTVGPTGKFPDIKMYFLPVMCQHCDKPACVAVCPTGASQKRPDGLVVIDKDKCIGCQTCMTACPYGVRSYNPDTKVVEKCTACSHLIEAGKDPACVAACCGQARSFGDLDDPKSAPAKAIAAAGADNVHALKDIGNKPVGRYILHKKNADWKSS